MLRQSGPPARLRTLHRIRREVGIVPDSIKPILADFAEAMGLKPRSKPLTQAQASKIVAGMWKVKSPVKPLRARARRKS